MDSNGLQPLKIESFSGGKTDFPLGGAPNKAEIMDNFVIDENDDLITRPGAELKYDVRITSGNQIRNIIDNQDEILVQHDAKVETITGVTITEVLSPQAHSAFIGSLNTNKIDTCYWNKHTLGVTDNLTSPQKIYKNLIGNWTVTTLGLPDLMHACANRLANEIKSKYNAHRASLTIHLVADANIVTSPDAASLSSLFTLTDELTSKIQLHYDDAALVTPIAHTATFNRDIAVVDTNTFTEVYDSLLAIKTGFNLHDNGDAVHTIQGNHQIASTFEKPSAAGTAGTENYVIGMHYTYRYNVGALEFLERGPVYLIEVPLVAIASNITISKIPVLESKTNENWDDSNIKISIFRTVNGGSTLFYEKEISNGTTTTTLSMTDSNLQLNAVAYTEGDILDNEMPPPSKFIQSVNDFVFYGGVKENRVFKGNRLRITKPGQPYASPGAFYLDFEDDITGIGVASTYPIVFLDKAFYRVEGFYSSNGSGSVVKRNISQNVGCVSYQSIVTTKDGIYFAADDGFYFTDGQNYKKISHDINLTYEKLVNKSKITGTFDSLRNRVLWGVQVDGNSTDNDTVFVAFTDYSTPNNGHPILTWSGGEDPTNFSCSAISYINGELLRSDTRGYLLRHDSDLFSDVYINTTLAPVDFFTQTIFYTYSSCAFDFGDAQTRKWVSKINVNADNESSLSLNIETSNDNSGVFVELKPIVKKVNVEWGDPNIIWNESELRWNYNPIISEWRFMNAIEQNLRCMYKQVRFTNAYTEIDTSIFVGPASVNSTLSEVTLIGYPTTNWLSDVVNYYISFVRDGYVQEFKIINQVAGVLTLEDDEGDLVTSATEAWIIKGYKKREIFNLLNYVISFKPITMTQDTYRAPSV